MPHLINTLAFISMPSGPEWIIVLVIGLLIFGRRLPDVGRSVGKTIIEFRKGIKEVEDDVKNSSSSKSEARAEHKGELPEDAKTLPANESKAADSRAVAQGPIHAETSEQVHKND